MASFVADNPRRVCIVTSEIEGPYFNGGVASSNRGLALTLRQLGYAVDILYTQVSECTPVCLRGTFAGHVADYARLGIRLLAIFNIAPPGDWQARSYLVMQHLIEERYHLVFFDDLFGTGYYPLLARRTGSAELADTVMVVTAHGSLEWVSELEEAAFLNFDGLHLLEMERRSIELADVLKAPSRYILSKYARYGWTLPADTVVMPNIVSGRSQRPGVDNLSRVPIDEIVFFGRLETRKGLWLFLHAIDRIKYKLVGRTVTFLGKSRIPSAEIIRHSLGWPFKIRLCTDFNQEQALSYLRGPRRLAVMPSPEDNSPSTVLECLNEGIPFIASSGSGGEELIDPACHQQNLFVPSADKLAEKILQAVESGASTGRHAFSNTQLLADFSAFLVRVLRSHKPKAAKLKLSTRPDAVIFLAPAGQLPEAVAAMLLQAASSLDESVLVNVLAEQPETLRALLPDKGFQVFPLDALAEAGASIAAKQPRVVALCEAGWVPDKKWFERAATCFGSDICAVTGMAVSRAEPKVDAKDLWFSNSSGTSVERYLMGNAAALLTVMQSTNSGFVLLRADVLDMLDGLDPYDHRHGRLRPSGAIIHELMSAIVASGRRFELIPDLAATPFIPDPLCDRASEGIALQHADRHLLPAATGLWAVNRLAVDAGIDRIRIAEGRAYREALSRRVGFAIDTLSPASPSSQQVAELARMAGAVGQTDLSLEILLNTLPGAGNRQPLDLKDFVNTEAASIDLLDQYRKGKCVPLNIIYSYSINPVSETELQLHANPVSDARAAIAFPNVDLSGLDAFSARVSLPNSQARPVRFRIDIFAENGSGHHNAERILQPGQAELLQFSLPLELRAMSRVIIGVEMADPFAPHDHAYVRLANMRLTRLGLESIP